MIGMMLVAVVLAAWATGLSLVGWIDQATRDRPRPAKTRKAPARPLRNGSETPNLISAKRTTWARVPGTPDKFEPRRLSSGDFGTSMSPAEQAVTAGTLYRVRTNVPRLADRVNALPRAFGVGRRSGVGTHRVSRVPIRKAQPEPRRGVASGWLPSRKRPFRRSSGPGPDARELPTHPALARR